MFNLIYSEGKWLFSLPSKKKLLFFSFLILIFFSAVNFFLNRSFFSFFSSSMLLFLSIFSCLLIFSILSGRLNAKQCLFLTILVSLFIFPFAILSIFFASPLLLIVGSGLVLFLLYNVFYTVLDLGKKAFPLSLILSFLFLFFSFFFYLSTSPTGLLKQVMITYFVFSGIFIALMFIISHPVRRLFGIKMEKALPEFFSSWLEEERDFEKILEKTGEEMLIPIKKISFAFDRDKIDLIVPYFHFGPFGKIGSSNFPSLLDHKREIVIHGPSTHEQDLVSGNEVEKAIKEIRKMKMIEIGEKIEIRKNSNFFGIRGKDFYFASFSNYPYVTEDIDFTSGLLLEEIARKKKRNVVVADQHNVSGEIKYVYAGSEVFEKYKKELLSKDGWRKTRVVVGYTYVKTDEKNIGGGGIKILYLSGVYLIVIDGNGIRKEDLDKILSLGNVVVFTTDSHEKNKVQGIENPVVIHNDLLEKIKHGMKEAYKGRKRAKVYFGEKKIKLRVIGPEIAFGFTSSVLTLLNIIKILIPLLLVLGVYVVVSLF